MNGTFTHTGRAYYGRQMLAGRVADEVVFGLGDGGEVVVRWHHLSQSDRLPTPRLDLYSDTWAQVPLMAGLFEALARQPDIQPAEFCALLVSLGLQDNTPTEMPADVRRATRAEAAVEAIRRALTLEDVDAVVESFMRELGEHAVAQAWHERRRRRS